MFENQELIIMIGGPGSGKGTHSKHLQDKYHYHHISTGDLIRAKIRAAATSGEISQQDIMINQLTNAGELLPDALIVSILKEEMLKYPEAKGFLIDGCPRTLKQAEMMASLIKPHDKVLYLHTTPDIMAERMLARQQLDGRSDDVPEIIAKRIKTYEDITQPVITYLKQCSPHRFHQIDTGDEFSAVALTIEAAFNHHPIVDVGGFELLKLYWTSGSFAAAIDALEKSYSTTEFRVYFSYIPMLPSLYIFQQPESVKSVLAENMPLGYQYQNANVAHQHDLNILALQATNSAEERAVNPLWQGIHKGLIASVGTHASINQLIDKHIATLFSKKNFHLDKQFEKFMLSFWCEYLFGAGVNVEDYTKTREKLLAAMRYAYYNNQYKNTPILGELTCRFYGWMKSDEFAEVDNELLEYIAAAHVDSLIGKFKENLRQESNPFPKDKVDRAVLDNAFDMILVFDFLHNALYETLALIVRDKLDADNKRRNAYAPGLHSAFLFPFRSRTAERAVTLNGANIEKGSHIYLNLAKAGVHHSYGPRACIGNAVSSWVKDRVLHHLHDMELRIQEVTYPESRANHLQYSDVPMTPERYLVRWEYPRHYLQHVLPHFQFKSIDKFYDVMRTFENPRLAGYMTASFVDAIESLRIPKDQLVIVAPEVRGIPIAAMVAQQLDAPQVYIRKAGKIPGPVISHAYANAYSVAEVLEISQNTALQGKKVILIDDGIASGGTTVSCCKLIEALGGEVSLILAMINHQYKEKVAGMAPYVSKMQTLFDFDKQDATEFIDMSKKIDDGLNMDMIAAAASPVKFGRRA